jgi:hypothetical protein
VAISANIVLLNMRMSQCNSNFPVGLPKIS